jgi:ribosomal protein S12 methylthiotransferase accessory factor
LRAVAPAATLRRIRPLIRAAGITRLADVTGLDWIGLPVYQAIRPNSRVLTVSQGKGLTRAQAQVSALMEALEGFHAEEIGQPSVRETVGAMRRRLAYDPYALPLARPVLLNDAVPVDWVPATDLWTGAASWVPRQLCELDACVAERLHVPLFRPSSNGLASGNTLGEAVLHGLCEVLERHCCERHGAGRFDPQRCVIHDSVTPSTGQRLLQRLARAGMDIRIVDMSEPDGVPCFEVWLDHPDGPALTQGAGCHSNRSIALIRALTEAVQSRLTYISGTRDDIPRDVYRPSDAPAGLRPLQRWAADPRCQFTKIPSIRVKPFFTQLQDVVGRVRSITGMSPVAVDLTRSHFAIPVVFVVAPGLRPPRRP